MQSISVPWLLNRYAHPLTPTPTLPYLLKQSELYKTEQSVIDQFCKIEEKYGEYTTTSLLGWF